MKQVVQYISLVSERLVDERNFAANRKKGSLVKSIRDIFKIKSKSFIATLISDNTIVLIYQRSILVWREIKETTVSTTITT